MVEPLESLFPGLHPGRFQITSPKSTVYNCIAWAAGDTDNWWWPDDDLDNEAIFWPPGIAREETLAAFVAAFSTLGFVACDEEEYEPGYEKVALFAHVDGVPTHAARQLPAGRWSSKLGFLEDIEHELHDLSGSAYGTVVQVLKRPTASNPTVGG
jgi:hypothetical protein